MRRVLFVLLLICATPWLAWGDEAICEDTVTVGKYRRYIGSIDPTTLTLQANEVCHLLSDPATIAAQRALCYDSNVPPPTIPAKYRMVSAQLCVEMPQSGTGPLTKD